MSGRTILAVLLVASFTGNAAFLVTTFSKRLSQRAGASDPFALTAEQAANFQEFKQKFKIERKQVHQKMAELRGMLADEFAKETPDRQRMLAAAVEMAQVQTDMRPKLIDHLLALHALLTPAQRASFVSLMRTGVGNGMVCSGAMPYPIRDEEK